MPSVRLTLYESSEEVISTLILWNPNLPVRSRKLTYPQLLSQDTEIGVIDLKSAVRDRSVREIVVRSISAQA